MSNKQILNRVEAGGWEVRPVLFRFIPWKERRKALWEWVKPEEWAVARGTTLYHQCWRLSWWD